MDALSSLKVSGRDALVETKTRVGESRRADVSSLVWPPTGTPRSRSLNLCELRQVNASPTFSDNSENN